MHSSWPGGLSTHPAIHPWLFMAWAVFWFFFMVCSPYGAGLCLIVGFSQPILLRLSVVLHFLLHYSAIPNVMLFEPSLLGLFESATYSSLNDLVWSLGFLLHGLRAPASHLFPFGCPWPIYFPWASSALSNFASSWTFTNSFGFPRPNYFILHPWGS